MPNQLPFDFNGGIGAALLKGKIWRIGRMDEMCQEKTVQAVPEAQGKVLQQ